jgi:hypothetical protein
MDRPESGCSPGDMRFDSDFGQVVVNNCHLDILPVCARQLVSDPDPADRLFRVGDHWWATSLERLEGMSSYYHGFDISTSLPRGYGYSLGLEGGDPERDDINLETLAKASGSAAPWNR